MKITYYQRQPHNDSYSIERVFQVVSASLPPNFECKTIASRFKSKGFWKRMYNILEAFFYQSDINHITGDVHYLVCLLRKRKTILTIHDCITLGRLSGIRKKLFWLLWYWLPVKRSAIITVISESTKNELLKCVTCDPNKVRVIYDPISNDFKPVQKEFNVNRPTILQVGTGANKNLHRVAEALKGIACHLRIVGRLSDEQVRILKKNLIDYATIWNLSDEEIVKEYQYCDMLVFASTYEGFGLPIVEAQATGRPVVTSNLLSMPEVAGDAACLVNPFDVEQIRAGILKIIRDEKYREELIQKGFKNVSRFSPEIIIGKYLQIYKEILGNSL